MSDKQGGSEGASPFKNKSKLSSVLLGEMFLEWRELKSLLGLSTDCDLARLLINSYRQHNDTPNRPSSPHSPPLKTLSPSKTPSPAKTPSTAKTPSPAKASSPQVTLQPPNLNAGDISSISPGSSSTVSVLGEFRYLSSSTDGHDHVNLNQDMDDCELNALENSRISVEFYDEELEEWIPEDEEGIEEPEGQTEEEDEEWSGEEDDLDSDPESDYVPQVRMRSSCSKLTEDMRSLPIITPEEEVFAHDQSVAEGNDEDLKIVSPQELEIEEESDIVGLQCCITYTECLLVLVRYMKLPYNKCKLGEEECRAQVIPEPEVKPVGSGIILQWNCAQGHLQWKWCSQPRFKYKMQGGDFMLASSILLSGNNYSKVNLMFKFMNMGCVGPTTFHSIQGQCCVPAIKKYWKEENARTLRELKNKENVVLLGDGCMDSPGHCAQLCTYTTMDHHTKEIVSVVLVDKRETDRKSARTEKAAFQRMMASMEAAQVPVKEVCTDAHPQISALMHPDTGEYGRKGIFHSLDVWHGAQNLLKKIVAAGQEKGCTELEQWASYIINHFWRSCQKSEGNYEVFVTMWIGALHHVCNKHSWALGSCRHPPLEDTENRTTTWLVPGSAPHNRLRYIMLDKKWLKSAHKFLRFRVTSELESFQNHIQMYASKRFAFSPEVYTARCLLAAIDYNKHKDRPVAKPKSDGEVRTKRSFQKKSDRWTYCNVKEPKKYEYIPELQGKIVRRKIGRGMKRKQPMSENDPRRLGPLPEHPAPPTALLVQ